MSKIVDIIIIGGGINGVAVAREAALNGLSVMLVEKDAIAAHTSSASTKLIHGGLRYLEHYEFGLVREALRERERLLRLAPELVRPMAFVLPHENAVRSWWLVRLGLMIYDRLGGLSVMPRSRGLRADDAAYQAPLKRQARGFVYWDGHCDDAGLTRSFATDAAANGAEIVEGCALIAARREGDVWHVDLSDGRSVRARILVNAGGPWVSDVLAKTGTNAASHVRLVKGSHIVVSKLYDGDHAYMLQQPDRRVVFAVPAEDGTAIGTTDVPVEGPEDAKIDHGEITYLCAAANHFFAQQIAPADIIRTWSGIRPLLDNGAADARAVTRDYRLDLDTNGAPLLSIFGGKITTARALGEDALGKLGYPSTATKDRPIGRVE